MIEFRKKQTSTIDNIFILALLTLFSAVAFLVVFIGAKEYHSIADSMSDNYKTRTVASYLQEKLNQNDVENSISVSSVGGCNAISIRKTVNASDYYTFVYCYDGYLWEITGSSTLTVSPGDGQRVIEAHGLSADYITDNLIKLTVTDALDNTRAMYVSLDSAQQSDIY